MEQYNRGKELIVYDGRMIHGYFKVMINPAKWLLKEVETLNSYVEERTEELHQRKADLEGRVRMFIRVSVRISQIMRGLDEVRQLVRLLMNKALIYIHTLRLLNDNRFELWLM
jgi:hypothetical protein